MPGKPYLDFAFLSGALSGCFLLAGMYIIGGQIYNYGVMEGEERAAQVKCAKVEQELEVHPMTGERIDR